MSEGIKLTGVEIFATGVHRGKEYTTEDLDDMVSNFNKFSKGKRAANGGSLSVPLVVGHEEVQRTDEPASGWLAHIWRDGNRLLADVGDVAPEIAQLIKAKRYTKVSAEVYDNPPEGLQGGHGRTLRRVAILGGEIPQIKTLADIPMPKKMSESFAMREVRCGPDGCYEVFFDTYGDRPMLSPTKRAALAALMLSSKCKCGGSCNDCQDKFASFFPKAITRAVSGIGRRLLLPIRALRKIGAERELDRYAQLHRTKVLDMPEEFKDKPRPRINWTGLALRGAAVLGTGAVLRKTRAAKMVTNRVNKQSNRAVRAINRGHAWMRKKTGFRFCDHGFNAGKPGPCPQPKNTNTVARIIRPIARAAVGPALVLTGRQLIKASPTASRAVQRTKDRAGHVYQGARGLLKRMALEIARKRAGVKVLGELPEQLCDRGPNAGKPGPCPDFSKIGTAAGLLTGGPVGGTAALATRGLKSGVKAAIGTGLISAGVHTAGSAAHNRWRRGLTLGKVKPLARKELALIAAVGALTGAGASWLTRRTKKGGR